jgi:asparagine synthase (glutamine-hydrolysing)
MCGIAGLVGKFDRERGESGVAAMIAALAQRGPDGEGIEIWSHAILGHRRLAIFDLSELGHQPMLSPDRRRGVVFNGAIYNFRPLRAELEARGYGFISETDTEVLLHGYDAWGIDELVQKLRGMFAFGLWDESVQKLFLVRDRLGVKPLVYVAKNGVLAFASTIRALKTAGFVGEIDDRAVAEYLEFGYVTDDRTIYRSAAKLPAASILEWSNGTAQVRQYWQPPKVGDLAPAPSFEEAVEETERLFLQAVERRLQADVPVGALLSGGIDSSLVCWAIAKLGADITAFTVSTPGDPWDESSDASATAAQLGIHHKVLPLSPDETCDLSDLTEAYAEPFACASALGMLSVSKAVRREATVLLTGDGGDDVFLGYPEHRNLWLAQKLATKLPGPVAELWLQLRESFPRRGVLKRAGSLFDYSSGGLGAVACAHDGLPMYRKNNLLGSRLEDAAVDQRNIEWSRESALNLLREFLVYDRKTRFVGEYMTKVDGSTMFHALEARSPFLDQDLWEFAATLPFVLRLRGNTLKAVLRELARRRLGERVASSRKRGFGIPVQRWLTGRWRGLMTDLMHDSALEREGWIRSDKVLLQLERAAHSGWAPNQLWYVLVLELWLRSEKKRGIRGTDGRVSGSGRTYSPQLATTSPRSQ